MEGVEFLPSGISYFSAFSPKALAAFSDRTFDAAKNLSLFVESIGGNSSRFCTVQQVHGNRVILGRATEDLEEADGIVTQEKNLALVIRTADCVPVFFYDPQRSAVGICHAGWKGTHLGIVSKTVEKLRECFGSKTTSLKVALGPSIRESCYEVEEEFENYFPGFVKKKESKHCCDLIGVIKKQLFELGIAGGQMIDSGLCTVCSIDRFFSARREGVETGRFLSTVMLK